VQLAGKQLVWSFLGGLILALGAGLLIGRQFPVRRFERFGESHYLVEPATGKVCDPFKDPNESTNPIDRVWDSSAPKNAEGFQIVKPAYPPACGK
jgi:hypothetical protein